MSFAITEFYTIYLHSVTVMFSLVQFSYELSLVTMVSASVCKK